jgi:hypothetical protein
MRLRSPIAVLALSVLLLPAIPAQAQKIPPEFRSAFEGKVRANRTYGVVVKKGVPTTSIYGVKGDQTDAFYSVDIKGGEWETSKGLFDFNQVVADVLVEGEVVEIVDVTFKDARIDLRTVSLEAHKVSRGSGFSQATKREPVSTNFKFFFPFAIRGTEDLPQALEYIESYLRLFPSEQAARAFAGQVVSGTAPSASNASPPRAASKSRAAAGPPPATAKKEIKVGMTPLEVLEVLGKPEKEVSFETKTRWTYPDLTVLFESGRVKEVKF